VALATTGDSTGRSPSTAPSTYPAPRVTVAAIYYGASFSSPVSAELVRRLTRLLVPANAARTDKGSDLPDRTHTAHGGTRVVALTRGGRIAPPDYASLARKAPGCQTARVERAARSTRRARFNRGPQSRKSRIRLPHRCTRHNSALLFAGENRDCGYTARIARKHSVGLQSPHTANRSPPTLVTRHGSVRGYRASRPPASRCGAVLYARARAHARADPAKRATQAPPPIDAHGALGTHTQSERVRPPQKQPPPCRSTPPLHMARRRTQSPAGNGPPVKAQKQAITATHRDPP